MADAAFNRKFHTLVQQKPYRVECRIVDTTLIARNMWTVIEERKDDPSHGSFILYETLRAEFTGPDFRDPKDPGRSGYTCKLVTTAVRGEDPAILEPGELRSPDFFARDLGDLEFGRAHRTWVKETRARNTTRSS
jgi:hypothetical protein